MRRGPFASRRSAAGDLAAELSRGGAVAAPCRLRRTSARGWGPWTTAELALGPVPGGEARWSTDDAVSVGFASTNERIDLPFTDVTHVHLRSVRFRTEAFWGMDADIVVVASERGTIEVAVPPGDAEAVAARLEDLLHPAHDC